MDHAAFRELAAAAVLEDLDPDEQVRFAAHRAGCRPCAWLVEDLLEVAAGLATLAPPRTAPVALHGSVLAAIAAEAVTDGAGTPARIRRLLPSVLARPPWSAAGMATARPWRHRSGPWTRHRLLDLGAAGLVAALAIVAVGLAGRDVRLAGELGGSRQAMDAVRAELAVQTGAVAVAADPAHRDVTLRAEALAPAASATVVYVPGTTSSYVVASDLPATPAGKVYELWVADAGGVHGLGTYTFDGRGTFVAPLGVDLAPAAATMVTLEPVGGARGEPGPQVLFGAL